MLLLLFEINISLGGSGK